MRHQSARPTHPRSPDCAPAPQTDLSSSLRDNAPSPRASLDAVQHAQHAQPRGEGGAQALDPGEGAAGSLVGMLQASERRLLRHSHAAASLLAAAGPDAHAAGPSGASGAAEGGSAAAGEAGAGSVLGRAHVALLGHVTHAGGGGSAHGGAPAAAPAPARGEQEEGRKAVGRQDVLSAIHQAATSLQAGDPDEINRVSLHALARDACTRLHSLRRRRHAGVGGRAARALCSSRVAAASGGVPAALRGDGASGRRVEGACLHGACRW